MRLRLPMRRAVLAIALFVFALVTLVPMRAGLGWFDAGGRGLAAREAAGTLWLGGLKEAQFGGVPLGDINARLNFWPLLIGRARLSLWRDEAQGPFQGAISVSRHSFGIEDATGELRAAGLFAPLPHASLTLEDVSVRFSGGLCESASGQVRANLSGALGGVTLPSGLRGEVRCADGAVLLALAGQSAMERVNIRIGADGRYRIDLAVRADDPAAVQRLLGAGFTAGPGGYVRRLDGSF
ncbi:MAG TPA: type II secretion system protein N [Allosphingosinicella sp.]|nr:type II secretion system protein N [Allosphingosinicella sp.]